MTVERLRTVSVVPWVWRIGMMVLLLIVVNPTAGAHTIVRPTAPGSGTLPDWLTQGQLSIVEDATTRPFQWLLENPKDPIAVLNRSLDVSLLRAQAVLLQWLGVPVWQRTTIVLQHDEPTAVRVRGATLTWQFAVGTQVRRYSTVMPYGFHPVQDHIEPLTTARYDNYGIGGSTVLTSPGDDRPRLARWYGMETQVLLQPWMRWLAAVWLLIPFAVAWWWSRRQAWWVEPAVGVVWIAPWLWGALNGTVANLEPILAVGVTVLAWTVIRRFGYLYTAPTRVVVAAAAVGLQGMHAYATAYWMQGVDLAEIPDIQAYLAYLGQMRMAMPIPLLSIEYLLVHSGIPGIYAIGYLTFLCRAVMLIGLVLALRDWWSTPRQVVVGAVLLGLAIVGLTFVFRFYDRNVWMVYDAWLGTSLVILVRVLERQLVTRAGLLLVGACLAWLDSLRPFMMPLVPLLVVWIVATTRHLPRRAAYVWLALPLLPNLLWHAYHITVLGQWSWSSHAGMNVARAWIPEQALAAMRAAPADMNSAGYRDVSNALLTETKRWIIAYPGAALSQGLDLLWAMLSIPVEMRRLNDGGVYTVIEHPASVAVWGYRVLCAGALALHGWLMVRVLWQRDWRSVWWVHASLICAIVGVSALTENGEQARFIAAMVPALLCLPFGQLVAALRRRQNERNPV